MASAGNWEQHGVGEQGGLPPLLCCVFMDPSTSLFSVDADKSSPGGQWKVSGRENQLMGGRECSITITNPAPAETIPTNTLLFNNEGVPTAGAK